MNEVIIIGAAASRIHHRNYLVCRRRQYGKLSKEDEAAIKGIEESPANKIAGDLVTKEALGTLTAEETTQLADFRKEGSTLKIDFID